MSLFVAKSEISKELVKTARLINNLNINAIIIGEEGTGKSLLANEILPGCVVADGSDFKNFINILNGNDTLIIENFHRIINYENLDFSAKKIVAISPAVLDKNIIDKFFGITLKIPPLSQRKADIEPLMEKFIEEAKELLMVGEKILPKEFKPDISKNCHSLKKGIFLDMVSKSLTEKDIIQVLKNVLASKISGNNAYRDNLKIFDKAIIEEGLNQYGSQLKLSEVLGLNRNTLRKKVAEIDGE